MKNRGYGVERIFLSGCIMALFLLWGCGGQKGPADDRPTLSVSIEPIRYIAEQITGNDFKINVLVPDGTSPETYEPTTTQMRDMANSVAYFSIGILDFEQNLNRMIPENMPGIRLIRLDRGIDLIRGDRHHHSTTERSEGYGVDPHIWLSVQCIRQMARTMTENLLVMYPDSIQYQANCDEFMNRLEQLNDEMKALFSEKKGIFMIYHPALTYFARDYSLTQIAIEEEGKEPSAEHIRHLIDAARREQIRHIFYQSQFSHTTVRTLTEELGIDAVPFDPLAADVVENLRSIGYQIAAE